VFFRRTSQQLTLTDDYMRRLCGCVDNKYGATLQGPRAEKFYGGIHVCDTSWRRTYDLSLGWVERCRAQWAGGGYQGVDFWDWCQRDPDYNYICGLIPRSWTEYEPWEIECRRWRERVEWACNPGFSPRCFDPPSTYVCNFPGYTTPYVCRFPAPQYDPGYVCRLGGFVCGTSYSDPWPEPCRWTFRNYPPFRGGFSGSFGGGGCIPNEPPYICSGWVA
jgi:hypothetical protein